MDDPLKDAFRSARLVYRAVRPETDLAFAEKEINGDPATWAGVEANVLRPEGHAAAQGLLDTFAKDLLGVVICLRPEEDVDDAKEESATAAGSPPRAEDARTGADYVHVPPTNIPAPKPENERPAKEGKQEPRPIGMLRLYAGSGGPAPTMQQHRRVELGIALAPAHQGRGYGTEAIEWALAWAFRRANLHRVGLVVAAFNARAEHVYRKVGFVLEGARRETRWSEGRYWDERIYGMLEGEWWERHGTKLTASGRG
jgi:GNAT superfamily N-acetyltransferase